MASNKNKLMLFDILGIIFNSFIEKLEIKNKIKNFDIIWMGQSVKAKYVALPEMSIFEHPTLVYVDLREIDINSVRILLLSNIPKFVEMEDHKLDHFLSIEVGEFEFSASFLGKILGNKIRLFLEYRNINLGVTEVTEEKSLFLNLYASQLINSIYVTYLNDKYFWVKEYFKDEKGNIYPLIGHQDGNYN